MNVFRINFNEYLMDKANPKADLLDCGLDSVVVVHDGDGLSACNTLRKNRLGRKLPPYKDEDTGKTVRAVVAEIDIDGFEPLHKDVEILK